MVDAKGGTKLNVTDWPGPRLGRKQVSKLKQGANEKELVCAVLNWLMRPDCTNR